MLGRTLIFLVAALLTPSFIRCDANEEGSAYIVCEHPGDISHGFSEMEQSNPDKDLIRPGDQITYECFPGYSLGTGERAFVMKCTEDGFWDVGGEPLPTCTEITCPKPEAVANGHFTPRDQNIFKANESVFFTCNEGYSLRGDHKLYCQDPINHWSGKQPYCKVTTCDNPGKLEHGHRTGSSFRYGDTVSFECFGNYKLLGSRHRTCGANGRWNGSLTRCDDPENHCPNPGVPIGSIMVGKSGYNVLERVTYKCKKGYKAFGSKRRTCLPNGRWSGEELKCIGPDSFDDPPEVGSLLGYSVDRMLEESPHFESDVSDNRVKRELGKLMTGAFHLIIAVDASGSISTEDFRYAMAFAIRLVEEVSRSPVNTEEPEIDVLLFNKVVDNIFRGLRRITLAEKLEKMKEKRRDVIPGEGTDIDGVLAYMLSTVIPSSHNSPRSKKAIVLLSDGYHNMGPSPKAIAETLKDEQQWNCEIFGIGIGNNTAKRDLLEMSSGPKHSFMLREFHDFNAVMDKLTVERDYTGCGESSGDTNLASMDKISHGSNAKNGAWPFIGRIFRRQKNQPASTTLEDKQREYDRNGVCGATIISESWLLTAAHCFWDEDDAGDVVNYDDPNDIFIRLGATVLKGRNAIHENHRDYEVEKIILHTDYDPVQKKADIALLKLKKPLRYSSFIRHACLPEAKYNDGQVLYQADLEGQNRRNYPVVLGWGATDHEPRGVHHLQQAQIPLHGECDRDTAVCAGPFQTGSRANACQGDSGGPLLREVTETDSKGLERKRFVLIGVVSAAKYFDSQTGCPNDGSPVYFTDVRQYLQDFIVTEMEE